MKTLSKVKNNYKLPKKFKKNGDRNLFMSNDRLSRICLGWTLAIGPAYSRLRDSNYHGRVVIVSNGAKN